MLNKKLQKILKKFKSMAQNAMYSITPEKYDGNDVKNAYEHGISVIDSLIIEIEKLENRLEKVKTPLLCKIGFHKYNFLMITDGLTIEECTKCHKQNIEHDERELTSTNYSIKYNKSGNYIENSGYNLNNPFILDLVNYYTPKSETLNEIQNKPNLEVINNKNVKKQKTKRRKPKLKLIKNSKM